MRETLYFRINSSKNSRRERQNPLELISIRNDSINEKNSVIRLMRRIRRTMFTYTSLRMWGIIARYTNSRLLRLEKYKQNHRKYRQKKNEPPLNSGPARMIGTSTNDEITAYCDECNC